MELKKYRVEIVLYAGCSGDEIKDWLDFEINNEYEYSTDEGRLESIEVEEIG